MNRFSLVQRWIICMFDGLYNLYIVFYWLDRFSTLYIIGKNHQTLYIYIYMYIVVTCFHTGNMAMQTMANRSCQPLIRCIGHHLRHGAMAWPRRAETWPIWPSGPKDTHWICWYPLMKRSHEFENMFNIEKMLNSAAKWTTSQLGRTVPDMTGQAVASHNSSSIWWISS